MLTQQLSDRWKLTYRYHRTGHQTTTNLAYQDNRETYDESYFRQTFNRAEVLTERTPNNRHCLTAGAGYIAESVEATR